MKRSLLLLIALFALAVAQTTSAQTGEISQDSANSLDQQSVVPLDTIPANPEAVSFKRVQLNDDLGSLLGAIRPTEPVEYVEWRLVRLFRDREYAGDHQVKASAGVRCEDEPCKSALDSLVAEDGVRGGCAPLACLHYLAVVRGDATFAVASTTEAIDLLGRVDTEAEAVLLVMFEGFHPTDVRTEPAGGYLVLAEESLSDCPIEHQTRLIHILEDGRLVTVAKGAVRRSGGCI